MVGLDLKCELAANNVAKMRMEGMYGQYGPELVDAVSQEMIRYSETILRRRLREIPDGVWREEAEIGLEEKWKVALTLRKEGDRLVFDFTGTDKQAKTGINLPYHATFGACFEVVLATLGYDIPKNHGVMKPLEVIAPEGTVVNVKPPAPVSLNTTSGGQTAKYVVKSALMQMLSTSEKWQKEVIVPYSGQQLAVHGGTNQYGRYYSTDFGLGALRGLGARTYGDGVDAGHAELSCPNIEWKELNFPLLHLFRRHTRDGGGAGCFRGGAGAETALMIHDAPEGHIKVTTHGVVGLNNSGKGIFGGYSGSPSIIVLHQETDVGDLIAQGRWPQEVDEFGGHARRLGYSAFDFKEGEVLFMRQGNSGGCGDPLERDAERVLRDVQEGLVSRAAAHDVYGVVVDENGGLDLTRTKAVRAARRQDRLKSASPQDAKPGLKSGNQAAFACPPSEILSVSPGDGTQRVRCKKCQEDLCELGQDWKKSCKESLLPPTEAGPLMKDMTGHFLMKQLYCPGCGIALNTELVAEIRS
jgi:N-methylhydantoinase B